MMALRKKKAYVKNYKQCNEVDDTCNKVKNTGQISLVFNFVAAVDFHIF